MPLYHYQALNSRGELLDGQMEVASNAEVIMPIEVTKLDNVLKPYPTLTDALDGTDGTQ